MNLRELVAELETKGKPEHSESPVNVLTEDGIIYEITGIRFDSPEEFEGLADAGSGDVWLMAEEA